MPHAYAIGHIRVKDADAWAAYRSQVPATLVPFGAELVFRARRAVVFAGTLPGDDMVVIRFTSVAQAQAWYDSPAYQALIPLRERAADVVLAVLEET